MTAAKIVITVPWGDRLGGAENMLWSFLRHFDRDRLEPVVVFLQEGEFERKITSLGLRTATVPAGRLRQAHRTMGAVRELARLLRAERPALMLNWTPKTQLYGASGAKLAGLADRVVWWQHGIPSRHWLDRAATALPAKAIGCSSHASAAAQALLKPSRPNFVVHPGIDSPPAISPAEIDRLRHRLGIEPETPVLGIVGRLQPWKGQHRFIQAIHELRSRGFGVHGLIVGGDAYELSPEYQRHLRRLAAELDLEDAITFTGQVDSAYPYLRLMDVFVNASDGEPFGIVILEAMASALPVVAFDSGGVAEVAGNGSAMLVAPGDQAALVEALQKVLEDPHRRKLLAAAARERYLAHFRIERMANDLTERLVGLAGE